MYHHMVRGRGISGVSVQLITVLPYGETWSEASEGSRHFRGVSSHGEGSRHFRGVCAADHSVAVWGNLV